MQKPHNFGNQSIKERTEPNSAAMSSNESVVNQQPAQIINPIKINVHQLRNTLLNRQDKKLIEQK